MKKISKQKSKSKIRKSKKQPANQYPAYILGIALFLVLSAETAVLAPAVPKDWHDGLSVLDMSSGVSSTIQDVKFAFTPAVSTAQAVNQFYTQAATVTASALDFSNPNPELLSGVFAVNNFYKAASQQMAGLLDLSKYTTHYEDTWQPEVAGARITSQTHPSSSP